MNVFNTRPDHESSKKAAAYRDTPWLLLVLILTCTISNHAFSAPLAGKSNSREPNSQHEYLSEKTTSHIKNQLITINTTSQKYVGLFLIKSGLIAVIDFNNEISQAAEIKFQFITTDDEVHFATVLGNDTDTGITIIKPTTSIPTSYDQEDIISEIKVGDKLARPIFIKGQMELQSTLVKRSIPASKYFLACPPFDNSSILEIQAESHPEYGGPLFDAFGRATAMNIAYFKSGSSFTMTAYSIDLVTKVADQINRFGNMQRGWIGIEIQTLTRKLRIL